MEACGHLSGVNIPWRERRSVVRKSSQGHMARRGGPAGYALAEAQANNRRRSVLRDQELVKQVKIREGVLGDRSTCIECGVHIFQKSLLLLS